MRKEKCTLSLQKFVKSYKNLGRNRISWRGHIKNKLTDPFIEAFQFLDFGNTPRNIPTAAIFFHFLRSHFCLH